MLEFKYLEKCFLSLEVEKIRVCEGPEQVVELRDPGSRETNGKPAPVQKLGERKDRTRPQDNGYTPGSETLLKTSLERSGTE